jgi:hypothetical protein
MADKLNAAAPQRSAFRRNVSKGGRPARFQSLLGEARHRIYRSRNAKIPRSGRSWLCGRAATPIGLRFGEKPQPDGQVGIQKSNWQGVRALYQQSNANRLWRGSAGRAGPTRLRTRRRWAGRHRFLGAPGVRALPITARTGSLLAKVGWYYSAFAFMCR